MRLRFEKTESPIGFAQIVARVAACCGYVLVPFQSGLPVYMGLRSPIRSTSTKAPEYFKLSDLINTQLMGRTCLSLKGIATKESNHQNQYHIKYQEESNEIHTCSWSLFGWIEPDGNLDLVQIQFFNFWWPMLSGTYIDLWLDKDYRAEMPQNAREYLFIRSLMDQTSASRAFCFSDGHECLTHAHYIFRRNSRRSKIIPAFEDYCREVGFACVDDLSSPVIRVPDFEPTGPVFAAIGSIDD